MAKAQSAWNNRKALAVKPTLRRMAAGRLKEAADWAVRNQVRHYWPRWDANAGRFPYHVHLPTDDYFLSTSWNTARTVQGLIAAWRVLGDGAYLAAAQRGLEYVKTLQVFAPEHPEARGAFIEETPLGDHIGPRDGMECSQALLTHYMVTGDKISLQRAGAYLDWLLSLIRSDAWPMGYLQIKPDLQRLGKPDEQTQFICAACAIPFVQYAAITKKTKYVTQGAKTQIDFVLENILQGDGSLRLYYSRKDHHTPLGDDATIYNDDGIGVGMLCVWKATGVKRYLDAAVAYGDWWLERNTEELPENYAMIPSVTIFLADLARATGEMKYVRFIDNISEKLFDLQVVRDCRPLVSGAFMGEDMAKVYRRGSNPGDYVCLRATAYGLLALAKLAAGNAAKWTPSYSAFGF